MANKMRALISRIGYTTASFVLALSTLTAAVPFILSERVGAVSSVTTVRPGNLNNWKQIGGGGSFSDAQSRIGTGSYKLVAGTAGQKHIAYNGFSGTALSDITELKYSAYVEARDAGTSVAPVLRIDTQLPKTYPIIGALSTNTTLVWEPTNGAGTTVGAWRDYDPLTQGRWWASPAVDAFPNNDTSKTWAEITALYPGATIRSNSNGGVYLGAGQNSAGGTWANFTGYVDNFIFNGAAYDFEAPANPVVTGENFNTHSGTDYKGINVGFKINDDFGTVSSVKVELYKDTDLLATNTSNANLLSLIAGGTRQLSTPFITAPGSYDEEYWVLGSHSLSPAIKPTHAVVTVVGTNGPGTTTVLPLVEPNDWNYENLFVPATPVHTFPADNAFINYNDFWFTWEDVDGAVSYEMQNSTNPAVDDATGSFQNVMWTGDYQNIQPTEAKSRSVGATGTWYWQVRAIDAYGNKSEWTDPWKVTIDLQAPNVSWQVQPKAVYSQDQGFHVRPITNEVGTVKSIYLDSVSTENLIRTLDSDHKNFDTTNAHNQALWDSLSDGKHKFVAVFADYAGNFTVSTSNEFLVDRTGPEITVKPESIGSVSDKVFSNVSFKLHDVNKVDKVTINGVEKDLTDNAWSDVNGVKSGVFGAVEGANVLVAYDIYGNTTTYEFTVDNTAPTATITYSPDGPSLTNKSVTVTLTASEAIDQSVLPGTWLKKSDTVFQKVFPVNAIQTATLKDLAGNLGLATVTIDWIDKEAPSAPILTGNAVRYMKPGSVVRTWDKSPSGDVKEYIYKSFTSEAAAQTPDTSAGWSPAPYAAGQDSYSISHPTGDSNRVIYYRVAAVDFAGNITWSNDTFRVVVDASNPVATISNVSVGTNKLLNFSVSGADAHSGVRTVGVNIYNENNNGSAIITIGRLAHDVVPETSSVGPFVESVNVSGLPSGTYTIRAAVRDWAENISYATYQFTVDNTAPDAPVILIANATGASGTAEPGSTVIVRVNGQEYTTQADQDGNWEVEFDPELSEGTYDVTVEATDDAGNTSSEASQQVIVAPAQNAGGGEEAPEGGILGLQDLNPDLTPENGEPDELGVTDNAAQAGDVDEDDAVKAATGLDWYWWVLIAAGAATILWWIIGAARRRGNNEA